MVDDENPFSFKKSKENVDSEVDKIIKEQQKKQMLKQYSESINRIKFSNDIKESPPKKDFLRTEFHDAQIKQKDGSIKKGVAIKDITPDGKEVIEFTNGIFTIDLNTDADWWFNRSCTVFPLLLDQGIRTHVDIKEGFKPERRKVEFSYLWVIFTILGIIMIVVVVMMFLGGG